MATYHEEHVPAYRWVVLGSLTSGQAIALATIFVFGLLLPDISDELKLSPSQQGWLGASAVFGNLILGIPLNAWLSRYRPWRVVALCFLGIAVFTLVQGWSPTLAILIVGRIALGISMIASQAPRALLIQQWTPATWWPTDPLSPS
jgi:predicted MFS family arabinose efflux permease